MSAQETKSERIKFANTLQEFNSQRDWYSERSGQFKARAQWIDIAVILAGALVAALPIFKSGGGTPEWHEVMVSFLGAAIVLGQGAQRIYRYGEIWPEYRLASERMKREWRSFINASDDYGTDEASAQALYIRRLERVIMDEQKIFFDAARSDPPKPDPKQ